MKFPLLLLTFMFTQWNPVPNMGLTEGDQLPSLIAAFFRGFTTSLVGGVDLAPINAQWELITSELEQRQCNGELHPDLAAQAYSVAKNTVSLGSALRDLRNELDESMEGMTSELQGLLREDIKRGSTIHH